MRKNRTKTIIATTRCDIRSACELARYFELKGHRVETLGSLFRLSIEAFAELIVQHEPSLQCDSHSEGVIYLEKAGLYSVQGESNQRGKEHLIKELSLEKLSLSMANSPVSCTPQEGCQVDPAYLAAVEAKLKEMQVAGMEPDEADCEYSLEKLIAFKPEVVEEEEQTDAETDE
jgi:hypothetical protein